MWYAIGLPLALILYLGGLFYLLNVGSKKELSIPILSFQNQFGETKTVADYKGKTILIDFWFAGCKPCLEEMKFYPELLEKYKGQLVILSCTIESSLLLDHLLEYRPSPWNFLVRENRDWIFFSDHIAWRDSVKSNSFPELLEVREYPTCFVINKEGQLIDFPTSGLYGVEKELSGYFGLSLTIRKFFTGSGFKETLPQFLVVYNILAFIILVITTLTKLIQKYFNSAN